MTDSFTPIMKKELATLLGVTVRSIEIWCRKGILPHWKIGPSVRFDLKAVRAALDARCGRNIGGSNGC
ncbi:MAG: helix-turn-helix domain-containing protein [Limisphaerales bacterium]